MDKQLQDYTIGEIQELLKDAQIGEGKLIHYILSISDTGLSIRRHNRNSRADDTRKYFQYDWYGRKRKPRGASNENILPFLLEAQNDALRNS